MGDCRTRAGGLFFPSKDLRCPVFCSRKHAARASSL